MTHEEWERRMTVLSAMWGAFTRAASSLANEMIADMDDDGGLDAMTAELMKLAQSRPDMTAELIKSAEDCPSTTSQ